MELKTDLRPTLDVQPVKEMEGQAQPVGVVPLTNEEQVPLTEKGGGRDKGRRT